MIQTTLPAANANANANANATANATVITIGYCWFGIRRIERNNFQGIILARGTSLYTIFRAFIHSDGTLHKYLDEIYKQNLLFLYMSFFN